MAVMKFKRLIVFLLFFSDFEITTIFAQQKSTIQEDVELEYLNKYEEKTPPTQVLPPVKKKK